MYKVSAAFLVASLGIAGVQESSKVASEAERIKDAHAVYAALLENERPSNRPADRVLLIAARAFQTNRFPPCDRVPDAYRADYSEALADSRARRDVSVVVDSSLNIGRRPYLLLNDAEIEEFMAASSGEIRKVPLPPNPKFQGAQDLYRLSDVYFNARRTFAFTIINRYCGSVCGSLNWHAFGKSSSGKWEQKFSCYGGDA